MEPKIKIRGTASLLENYRNEGDKTYYVNLAITVRAEGENKFFPRELKIEVPITEENYNNLRKVISESKAEEPVLRVYGELEVIVSSGCIN